jgi:aminoglycoside 6-adenylyltransferase
MVEWHSRAVHGPEYDTWFRGRFLEKWADPRVLKELREAFAYYDEKDVKRALMKTMGLFRWLATETGEILSYPYLIDADERVTSWVESVLSQIE